MGGEGVRVYVGGRCVGLVQGDYPMKRTKWLLALVSVLWTASAVVVAAQNQEQAQEQQQARGEEAKAKVDPTGTWKWDREFGEVTMHFTLRLKLQDGKLTGTLDTLRGEEATEPAEIEEAKLEGDKVTFAVTREFNDNEFTINYEGTVKEDAIEGLTKLDFGGEAREFDWAAKRGLDWQDVLGKWQMESETPDGNTFEWTLTLTKEEDDVKGIVASERFGESEVSEIAIKDAQLTFAVIRDFEGNEFRLGYKIAPRGDALKGSLQFGDNADQTFDFTGKRVKEEKQPAGAEEKQE
jgi:hypothetical protein